MPFKSKAQQRFLESKSSPLTEAQKREWESATDFKNLPERKPRRGRANDNVVRRSR
jgi:hypothetical protein